MDLEIRYQPGKSNASTDTLSCIPTASVASVVAASEDLGAAQRVDPDFRLVFAYLDKGTLPNNDSEARKVVVNSEAFDLTDGVLYHESSTTPGKWYWLSHRIDGRHWFVRHTMVGFLGTLRRRKSLSYSDDSTGELECERLSGGIVSLVWFVLLEKVRHSL